MADSPVFKDRRAPAPVPVPLDQAKFSTQREVTYVLLLIFAAVVARVMIQDDQAERSMILTTVTNLTLLAVGYWLGASKAAADSGQAMQKIAEASAPVTALAVAASRNPPTTEGGTKEIKADDVSVQAQGSVTVVQPPKENP